MGASQMLAPKDLLQLLSDSVLLKAVVFGLVTKIDQNGNSSDMVRCLAAYVLERESRSLDQTNARFFEKSRSFRHLGSPRRNFVYANVELIPLPRL